MEMFTHNRKFKLVISIILVVCMFAAIFYILDRLGLFLRNPAEAAEVKIIAEKQDKMGIDTETGFVLTTKQLLSEKEVRQTLQVVPDFIYDLKKGDNQNEYRIIPREKLAANTIYQLSFDTSGKGQEKLSWAFQTKGSFRIISSLPMLRSTDVPVDTGIEINFSHENYDFSRAKDYFEITPQVEGRFEQHKKTLVFIPKKLEPGTLYTVTVKEGFPVLDSDNALENGYSFTFETSRPNEEQDKFIFDIDTRLNEFADNEAPVLTAYFSHQYYLNKKAGKTSGVSGVEVNVYSYDNYEAFIKALAAKDKFPEWSYQARNYQADLSSLKKAAQYSMEFLSIDDYSHYIVFPEPLPAGYYAAEIKVGECIRHVWLQVSDLATYLALGEKKGIIWINDLKSKKPVENAKIEVVGEKISAVTDKDGVAAFEYDVDADQNERTIRYAKVSIAKKEAVVPFDFSPPYYGFSDNIGLRDYWKYMYLERSLFKPGDDLHFWGIVAPRGKQTQEIKELLVELKGTRGPYYGGGENAPILSQTVAVTNKTYEGMIKLPILTPDYYYLQVKYGDTVLMSRGFSVETYEKPAYQLSLTADKKAIFAGEGINFTAKASFFEGTPVPNLGLNYYIEGKRGNVTTGEKGTAKIPYIGQVSEGYYSSYYYRYISVSATLPEAGDISASDNIIVFGSKLYMKGEITRQGDSYTVAADLSQINLDKINAGEYPDEKNFLAGSAGNTLIKGDLYQDVWQKVEAGERYDFISKKVVKGYYYDYSSKHISDFSMITDEKGQTSYTGTLEPKKSYYIILSAEDSEGRRTERRLTVPGSERPDEFDYKYYHFADGGQENSYLPGEEVSLTVMANDKTVEGRERGFLYFRGQKQIETYEVSSSPEYSFTFNDNNIPNVNAFGVYFDGIAYQETQGYTVTFAKESKGLQVQVQTDKTEYRPGETVVLSVLVTDKNKKPVKAEVNLNLVDEAIYNMAEQHVDLLGRLYSDFIYMQLNIRKSHYHPSYGGGAEKGGEGDGERKDFRDTVLFTTLETNKEGKANTEFKLPDNLTSWRVTYHALTDSLQAGSGTAQIPVRLPFFIDVVMNSSYLIGDAPIITVRSFGEKLALQDTVSYSMKLTAPEGQEVIASNKGGAFAALDWQLPALQEGKYIVTIEGTNGKYKDKISKEVNVYESFLERTITKHALLADTFNLNSLSGIKEPVTLLFSDYEKSQYLRGVYQLAWQGGSRFEQQLASRKAKELLKEYFPDKDINYWVDGTETLLRYQRNDGGIAILPYADSDLNLTALAASCFAKDLDSRAMASYFYKLLEGDEEVDRSTALWGLSALKEPVLLQLNDMLRQEGLTPEEKIKLALAMADIGNGSAAKGIFEELLTKHSENLGSTMRINVGRDQDEIIKATTQMALLAARLDDPNKHKLYQYLLENHGNEILNLVEQAIILNYNLKYMNPEPVSFTYVLKDEKASKTLKEREFFKLTVLPDDIGSLKFSNISGKVGVVTTYSSAYKAEDLSAQDSLTIKRTYSVKNKEVTTIGRADLVEVTISYNIGDKAPAGSYEIVDILPAGLRYVSRPYENNRKNDTYLSYPTEVKGQKLTFAAHKGGKKIVYYARVTSPGEYTAEPALLSHVRSNVISVLSAKGRIVIK